MTISPILPRLVQAVLAGWLVLNGVPVFAAGQPGASEKEFCRLDKNSDREITFEEFSACEFHNLEHVKNLPYSDPELFSKSSEKKMTEDELKAYLFNKADRNKDRKIDRKEWEEFYRSTIEIP
ncbi:MAG: hypothetical protein M0042_14285 [Nitrospiraceae bacterium]|nr:hypothetical protein [Nitrospiraceae bacterium]